MSPRVLVIGAGPSGLSAIKEMRELNLDVVAVDARDHIGGVFAPDSNVTYEGLHLTTSNMFMAFSDFPPKDTGMKFWTKAEYYSYLVRYANHFELHSNIKLQTMVHHAKLDEATSKWEVTMESVRDQKTRTEIFDYMIVATGANHTPHIPAGIFEGFEGEIIHSSEYHSAEQVRGKNVLVVGVGESATGVSHTACEVARQVTVWGRRYPDMAPRFITDVVENPVFDEARMLGNQEGLLPRDTLEIVTTSRIVRNLPLAVWSGSLHGLLQDLKSKYGPQSARGVICDIDTAAWADDWFSSDTAIVPTKSMIMGVDAAKGKLDFAFSPKISCGGNAVTFHNPSYYKTEFTSVPSVTVDVDVIIACTGYKIRELGGWLDVPKSIDPNPRTWFKHCFPAGLGDRVAFLGYARPHSGGIPQCSEMLARYVGQILTGALRLPEDYADIAASDGACENECYHLVPQNQLLVDYYAFMMSVAQLMGCSPPTPVDPARLVRHWTFPLWPCFFRARGPGAKPATCDAVLNKFGPFDALAPMPFLAIELFFTFVMPFVNAIAYCLNPLIDLGKGRGLPWGYRWRMSKFHFMYSHLRLLDLDDLKCAAGQLIAGVLVIQHLAVTAMKTVLHMGYKKLG